MYVSEQEKKKDRNFDVLGALESETHMANSPLWPMEGARLRRPTRDTMTSFLGRRKKS